MQCKSMSDVMKHIMTSDIIICNTAVFCFNNNHQNLANTSFAYASQADCLACLTSKNTAMLRLESHLQTIL